MLLDIIEPNIPQKNEQPEKIVGIDFGTTNSLIAIAEGENITVIPDIDGGKAIRSVINYRDLTIPSVKRLFGKSLEEIKSGNFIPDYLKEKIALSELKELVIISSDQEVMPIEIAAEIFRKLKKNAEKYLKEPVTKAVVTVPAYFDDAAKTMVKNSAQLAGFEVLRLVAEPTAAAYSYNLDKYSEGNYVVYDLGGGTFDVSILTMRMGAFQVKAIGGNPVLGGDDFDLAIAKFLQNKYQIQVDINKQQAFIKLSRTLKEKIAKDKPASVEWFGINLSLTYPELTEVVLPLLKPTIAIIKKTIFESKIEKIDGIILVGGSTKLSLLKDLIKDEFKEIKIIDNINPDEAVVIGAAMHGHNLSRKQGDVLIDVVPLSLGIELMGGLVEKIITRNTPIPASASRTYTTYMDNQTGFDFHIVQGDREMAADCRSLMRFNLKNIPPMLAGKAMVQVNFNVDSDGLLTINAKELNTGIMQEVVVKPSYGLSEDKILSMLKDAFTYAEEDHQQTIKVTKETEIQAVINRLLVLLPQYEQNITKEQFAELSNECINLQARLKSLNYNQLDEALENLEKKSSFFIDKIISSELSSYLKGKEVNKI